MSIHHLKRRFGLLAVVLVTLTGTYNALVINSESDLSSDIKFVKRLDESYGIITPGRKIAAVTTKWKKLPRINKQIENSPVISEQVETQALEVVATVQEELNLNLTEVVNPNKWAQGLKPGEFSGNLSTSNGIIESLDVTLPNGDGVTIAFSEMNGNVFEYDLNGEKNSGMLYQVDHKSYMVTLTNGPLEGTRLKFSQESETIALSEPELDSVSFNF